MAAKKKVAKKPVRKPVAKKDVGCKCADGADAALKPLNGVLVGTLRLNKAPRRVYIAVEKLDVTSRVKPPYVAATYCPFCGKKVPE